MHNLQCHAYAESLLSRRLVAHAATAIEASSKLSMVIGVAKVVLTAMVLIARAGTSMALTASCRAGCSAMNWAIGGLTL